MKLSKTTSLLILLCGMTSCNSIKTNVPYYNNHLKYFGFVFIDTGWDDPTDSEIKTNYKDEVSGFSNIADIYVGSPTDDIVKRMKDFNDMEMKSWLHLYDMFFDHVGTNYLSGSQYDLRDDYKERWDE